MSKIEHDPEPKEAKRQQFDSQMSPSSSRLSREKKKKSHTHTHTHLHVRTAFRERRDIQIWWTRDSCFKGTISICRFAAARALRTPRYPPSAREYNLGVSLTDTRFLNYKHLFWFRRARRRRVTSISPGAWYVRAACAPRQRCRKDVALAPSGFRGLCLRERRRRRRRRLISRGRAMTTEKVRAWKSTKIWIFKQRRENAIFRQLIYAKSPVCCYREDFSRKL